MKPFTEENRNVDLLTPRPGEIRIDVSHALFLPANKWFQNCRTTLDATIDLTRILEGKDPMERRVVIKGFVDVPPK